MTPVHVFADVSVFFPSWGHLGQGLAKVYLYEHSLTGTQCQSLLRLKNNVAEGPFGDVSDNVFFCTSVSELRKTPKHNTPTLAPKQVLAILGCERFGCPSKEQFGSKKEEGPTVVRAIFEKTLTRLYLCV